MQPRDGDHCLSNAKTLWPNSGEAAISKGEHMTKLFPKLITQNLNPKRFSFSVVFAAAVFVAFNPHPVAADTDNAVVVKPKPEDVFNRFNINFIFNKEIHNISNKVNVTEIPLDLISKCTSETENLPLSSDGNNPSEMNNDDSERKNFYKYPLLNFRTGDGTRVLIKSSCMFYQMAGDENYRYFGLDKETSCAVSANSNLLYVLYSNHDNSVVKSYKLDKHDAPKEVSSIVLPGNVQQFDIDPKEQYIAYVTDKADGSSQLTIEKILNRETFFHGDYAKVLFFKDAIGLLNMNKIWELKSFPGLEMLDRIDSKIFFSSDRKFVFYSDQFRIKESPHLAYTDGASEMRKLLSYEHVRNAEFYYFDEEDSHLFLHTKLTKVGDSGFIEVDRIWYFDSFDINGRVLFEKEWQYGDRRPNPLHYLHPIVTISPK